MHTSYSAYMCVHARTQNACSRDTSFPYLAYTETHPIAQLNSNWPSAMCSANVNCEAVHIGGRDVFACHEVTIGEDCTGSN